MPTAGIGDLVSILQSVVGRLIGKLSLSPTQVAISLEEWPVGTIGEFYIFVSPNYFSPIQDQVDGGSRWVSAARGTLSVRLYTRSALDPAQIDTQRLTQTTIGIIRRVQQVIDALQSFFPEDGVGDVLTEEPLFWTGEGSPMRFRRNQEWLRCDLSFLVSHILPLDTSIDQ